MSNVKAVKHAEVSKLFHAPRTLPTGAQLEDLGREYLNPGERVVIDTSEETFHLTVGGLRSIEKPMGHMWTVPSSLRVTASSEEPAELIGHLRSALGLRARRPQREVSEYEVRRFMQKIKERPHLFTRGAVNAQLDAWGRAALPHLRDTLGWNTFPVGYTSYGIRYIEETFPQKRSKGRYGEQIVRSATQLMRYSAKPMDEFGTVGRAGWPVRHMFPSLISVYVNAAVELKVDWRREEFLERAMDGLDHGGMVLTHGAWPGLKTPRRSRSEFVIAKATDLDKLGYLASPTPVHLRPLSTEWRCDDFSVIARSAQLLLDRKPFRADHSTEPMWWRLRADPFGGVAHKKLIPGLYDLLRYGGQGNTIRIFNADSWIGIELGCIMMLGSRVRNPVPQSVWGIAIDGVYPATVRGVREEVERMLPTFGWPSATPPMLPSTDVAAMNSTAVMMGLQAYLGVRGSVK